MWYQIPSIAWTQKHIVDLQQSLAIHCKSVVLQERPKEGKGEERARGGGRRGQKIWRSTRPWRILVLCALDRVDLDPGPSHYLQVDYTSYTAVGE